MKLNQSNDIKLQEIVHLMTHKNRYACGVGKGTKHTKDFLHVTCEKCKLSTAYKKACNQYLA